MRKSRGPRTMCNWETCRYTKIYHDLCLECEPRDRGVILMGRGKGSSTGRARPVLPVREFGLHPEQQPGIFEGFEQGPCILLQFLLLSSLCITGCTGFFVAVKAKVIHSCLRPLPLPLLLPGMCCKDYPGCGVPVRLE